jgi:hypothetical protein
MYQKKNIYISTEELFTAIDQLSYVKEVDTIGHEKDILQKS